MRDLPGGFGGDDGFGGNFGLDGQLSFGGGLPTDQWGILCNTHPDGCDCPPGPRAVVQNLDELDFTRSACAAAQSGDVNKLERILKRNPEAVHSDGSKGTTGYTPLHYAARAGRTEAVQLLLKHGAHVDAQTSGGKATSLHRAAGQGHLKVVEALLAAGADACLQDSDGETALHKAASAGHPAVCSLLLKHSPQSATASDRHGLMPKDRCKGNAAAAVFAVEVNG